MNPTSSRQLNIWFLHTQLSSQDKLQASSFILYSLLGRRITHIIMEDNDILKLQCATNPVICTSRAMLSKEAINFSCPTIPVYSWICTVGQASVQILQLAGQVRTHVWPCGSIRNILPFMSGAPIQILLKISAEIINKLSYLVGHREADAKINKP